MFYIRITGNNYITHDSTEKNVINISWIAHYFPDKYNKSIFTHRF